MQELPNCKHFGSFFCRFVCANLLVVVEIRHFLTDMTINAAKASTEGRCVSALSTGGWTKRRGSDPTGPIHPMPGRWPGFLISDHASSGQK